MTLHDFLLRLFLLASGGFCAVVSFAGNGVGTVFPGPEAQGTVPDMRVPVLCGGREFPCGVPALRRGQ